jgi:hypothetical protein
LTFVRHRFGDVPDHLSVMHSFIGPISTSLSIASPDLLFIINSFAVADLLFIIDSLTVVDVRFLIEDSQDEEREKVEEGTGTKRIHRIELNSKVSEGLRR